MARQAVKVEADSPEEAAALARQYMPDATDFDVSGPDEKIQKVSVLGKLFGTRD
jgi:hypothetical protein